MLAPFTSPAHLDFGVLEPRILDFACFPDMVGDQRSHFGRSALEKDRC